VEGAKISDAKAVAPVATVMQAPKGSDSRSPDQNASSAVQAPPQQISRLDAQVITSPLAAQQLVRAEGKSSIVGVGHAASSTASPAASTAERIRAAKAAMGLQ
jgi:hypothetical protein